VIPKMKNIKNVIFILSCSFLIIAGWSTKAKAQTDLKKKVDSLFVIASSGEVKYRAMVQPAIDSLVSLSAATVPILIDKLDTKSARERLTIIKIFKKIGVPAVPYLLKALKNPSGLVVQRICWSLGEIADTSAVDDLIKVSHHQRWQVREQAIRALGNIGDHRADSIIVTGLLDSIGQVRKAAAVADGKVDITNSIPRLVHLLGDNFYGARMTAAEALLKMDSAAVIPILADSMGSANPLVGNLGCYVLGEIGGDRAIEILTEQYGRSNPYRRAHAAMAIVEADPHDNCGYRDSLFDKESDYLTKLKIESAIKAIKNEQ